MVLLVSAGLTHASVGLLDLPLAYFGWDSLAGIALFHLYLYLILEGKDLISFIMAPDIKLLN